MKKIRKNRLVLVVAVSLWAVSGCCHPTCPASQATAGQENLSPGGAESSPEFAQVPPVQEMADPLPSWNDGPLKDRLWTFVRNASADGSPGFIPREERIAVFDNDGTLWSEKPMYFQMLFALDRVRALAPEHPEWTTTQPFKAVLENDTKTLGAMELEDILKLVETSHAGLTVDAFRDIVAKWFETTVHPELKKPYADLVYQPMLELLALLRDRGFKVYIVSGGGVEFMRAYIAGVYGIAPEQVIGSLGKTVFEIRDGRPELVKAPGIAYVDDKAGKPVAIHNIIGRRPVLAFGNSDGDLEMLQYTAAGGQNTFMGLIHHTDAAREWAYDKDSSVGRLDKALAEATAKNWAVVDMKADWKVVHRAPAVR